MAPPRLLPHRQQVQEPAVDELLHRPLQRCEELELEAIAPLIGSAVLALLCLYGSLRACKKQRLIDDVPTSKTTGVFIGLAELKGTAESNAPLQSHLAETPCIYYTWEVKESWSRTVTESYTDSDGKTQTRTKRESGWTTVASGGQMLDFYLKDDHGMVVVRPEGAKIEPITVFSERCSNFDALYYDKGPAAAISDSDHVRTFEEEAIPLHQPIYVIGKSRERSDVVEPEIAYDKEAPLFLISTRSEKSVSRGLSWQFVLFGLLGIVCAVGGALWANALMHHHIEDPIWGIGAGVGFLFFWTLGWVWTAYNSLVGLRQRVRRAESQVEVQLKRRHDLIPRLVEVVNGLKDHEKKVQTEVAELRSQAMATPEGSTGPDPKGTAKALKVIVENYPELKTNESFLNLQKELSDTETRIALARSFFNEIATHMNTRMLIIPDRFVCSLLGFKKQALVEAADFERAAVKVDLA